MNFIIAADAQKVFSGSLFMNVSSNLAMHEVTFHLMADGEKSQKKTSFAYEKSCSSSFIHWKKKNFASVCSSFEYSIGKCKEKRISNQSNVGKE